MAIKHFAKDGFGQIELNQVAFRRDGRIEAQCKLDATDFAEAYCENGMLLAVDRANRVVKFPVDGDLPIALNYSAEHMYDERALGLKNFALRREEKFGTINNVESFSPRLGYLDIGDKFTTNCIAYDDGDFADDDALIEALEACKETAVYGGACEDGYIKLSATAPEFGPVLKVVKYTDMPDGQKAVMLICHKA